MNTYHKYCPNVFVAKCTQEYKKGDIITLTTKRGKENKHIVHNLVGKHKTEDIYLYSITREDDLDSRDFAKKRAERLENWAQSADKKSTEAWKKSNKDADFLRLGEPIKVGHHSEKRHRKTIEDANNNMRKSIEFTDKAEAHRSKIDYWEGLAEKINLSMSISLEFFKDKLEEAEEYHRKLKNREIERQHSFSLTYAKKDVNELKNKVQIAQLLWGEK